MASLTTYYLEMRAPPARPGGDGVRPELTVCHPAPPTVALYRELFDAVGGPWNWVARKRLSDDELQTILTDPAVEVYLLLCHGRQAGFAELDRRIPGEVELKYFGLRPEMIGQGLGRWFLDDVLRRAWSSHPRRVWLHTCTEDHPRALAFYRQAGFVVYDRETTDRSAPATQGPESPGNVSEVWNPTPRSQTGCPETVRTDAT